MKCINFPYFVGNRNQISTLFIRKWRKSLWSLHFEDLLTRKNSDADTESSILSEKYKIFVESKILIEQY